MKLRKMSYLRSKIESLSAKSYSESSLLLKTKYFLVFFVQFSVFTEGCKKLCCSFCAIESSSSRLLQPIPTVLGRRQGLNLDISPFHHADTERNNIYVYCHKGGGSRVGNQASSHLWDAGKQVHSKRTPGLIIEPVTFSL